MVSSKRSLEIARAFSSPSMLRVARELGLFRSRPPTEEGARCLRATFERLGTTFIKLGQLLSTRPDLVSELYADELTGLQDDVRPVPSGVMRETIERSLGRSLSELFSRFDDQPLASASIAQTHAATLLEGIDVVVKVRRPALEVEVEQDLEILASLARRAEQHIHSAQLVKLRSIVDELAFSLRRELDMRSDAAHMQLIDQSLEEFPRLYVPRVVEELVTSEVLVMERVQGEKVTTVGSLDPEIGGELADEFLRGYMKQIIVDGVYHADPHAGNILLTPDDRLALLDFGLIGKIDDNTRLEFGLLLLALAENRAHDFTDIMLRMSSTTRHTDEQTFEQEIRRLLPRYRNTALKSINIGGALVEIQTLALRCQVGLPIQFALMGKTLSQVDSIARHLHPDIEPLSIVRDYATDVAWSQVRHNAQPSAMISLLGLPALSMLELPRRTERLIERLERGEVTIGVTPTELDELVAEARTIANRLSTAIIVAAVVIASGLLMNVDEVGEIAGYPALGLVGFLVASAIGGVLILRMLRTKGGL